MMKYPRSRRYLYVVPCTAVAWTLWTILVSFTMEDANPVYLHKSKVSQVFIVAFQKPPKIFQNNFKILNLVGWELNLYISKNK